MSTGRRRFDGPAIDRLMARVVHVPGPLNTPCWITDLSFNESGYQNFRAEWIVCAEALRILDERPS